MRPPGAHLSFFPFMVYPPRHLFTRGTLLQFYPQNSTEHVAYFPTDGFENCDKWLDLITSFHKIFSYIQTFGNKHNHWKKKLNKKKKPVSELFILRTYVWWVQWSSLFFHPLDLNRLITVSCRWLILSVLFRYFPVLYTAIISRKIKHSCTKPR